jgi:hypothetical protein
MRISLIAISGILAFLLLSTAADADKLYGGGFCSSLEGVRNGNVRFKVNPSWKLLRRVRESVG